MKSELIIGHTFPAAYQALTATQEDSLFLSRLWLDNFISTVVAEQDRVLWYGCKNDDGEPLLLLPLWQQPATGALQKQQALANYYTTLYQPLSAMLDEATQAAALDAIVAEICQQPWDVLELLPLNPTVACYAQLIQAFQKRHKHVSPYFLYGNWFLLTDGQSFQAYYANRPGQVKNTIKRRINKLKNHRVDYRLYQSPAEAAQAAEIFQAIYALTWKQPEPYTRFIPGLVQAAAERGWLRLGVLSIDATPAAAQLWFCIDKTAYIYKLGHDPQFEMYSPGTLLTRYLMEQALDVDKVAKVDFLSGDDSYKKDWMSHREERWGLQIANPSSWQGLKRAAKNVVSAQLKSVKNMLGFGG